MLVPSSRSGLPTRAMLGSRGILITCHQALDDGA